jgi:hypothetical protein
MTDADDLKRWKRTKVEALLKSEWLRRAGRWFRVIGKGIEKFNDDHVHIDEKMQQAPDVAWKSIQIRSSQTELNLAQAEEKKIAAVLAQRTMTAKTRQEEAAADTAETNAQLARVQLAKALLELSNNLRGAGTIVRFSKDGSVTTCPAPRGYDYEALALEVKQHVIAELTVDTPQTEETSQQPEGPSKSR